MILEERERLATRGDIYMGSFPTRAEQIAQRIK